MTQKIKANNVFKAIFRLAQMVGWKDENAASMLSCGIG